jgi:hypothetical protein
VPTADASSSDIPFPVRWFVCSLGQKRLEDNVSYELLHTAPIFFGVDNARSINGVGTPLLACRAGFNSACHSKISSQMVKKDSKRELSGTSLSVLSVQPPSEAP